MTYQSPHPKNDVRDDYREQPYRKRNRNPLDRLSLDWMLTLGSIAIVSEACQKNVSIASYLLLAAWVTLCFAVMIRTDKASNSIESSYRKFFKKYGKTGFLGIMIAVCTIVTLFVASAEPAHAVFLSEVQEKIITALTTGAAASTTAAVTGIVTLVINVIRVVLAIAIIFGVVKAIQSRDDQEQIKAQLMLPFIIIIGVAIIDLAATVIFV